MPLPEMASAGVRCTCSRPSITRCWWGQPVGKTKRHSSSLPIHTHATHVHTHVHTHTHTHSIFNIYRRCQLTPEKPHLSFITLLTQVNCFFLVYVTHSLDHTGSTYQGTLWESRDATGKSPKGQLLIHNFPGNFTLVRRSVASLALLQSSL